MQLLDDLKENKIYWNLKEEALYRSLWKTRIGSGYGRVVRQTAELMKTNRPASFFRIHSLQSGVMSQNM